LLQDADASIARRAMDDRSFRVGDGVFIFGCFSGK
jgi:hypothetical protein